MKHPVARRLLEIAYAMWAGTAINRTSERQRAAAGQILEEMGMLPAQRYRLKYADVGARFTTPGENKPR